MSPVLSETGHPVLASCVVFRQDSITQDFVLLYPEGIFVLNESAVEIVRACDGQATVAEIITKLAREYEVAEDALQADVRECLENLHHKNLITFLHD